MKLSRWAGLLGWFCLPGLLFLWSCRRENPSNFDRNLPPETFITGAPAESSLAYYRVHLYWTGADPDGRIDHFEFSVTDTSFGPGETTPGFNGFYRTEKSDSLFVLQANDPQILGHRFYVRSVDNEGKVDPTPAWAYFVAHDFNPPNVVFHSAIGSWTTSAGIDTSVLLTSIDQYSPTDTIGVGGRITVTWSGFDVDQGGYVVGYKYRAEGDPIFRGGTLADTMWTKEFGAAKQGDATTYYSGMEALRVRAIDDAGGVTQPDSVRSVVVNFAPITWVVDPASSTPVHRKVFQVPATNQTYPSGTTLADKGTARKIQFNFTGFDDPRDMVVNPANRGGVTHYGARRLEGGLGFAYQTLPDSFSVKFKFPEAATYFLAKPWPATNDLTSGNYTFLIRAQDELGRWGQPESLMVNVNYRAFFTKVSYIDPATGSESPIWFPTPSGTSDPETTTVEVAKGPSGEYPDLEVRFHASDNHSPPPNQDPRDFNAVVEEELSSISEYSAQLNRAGIRFEPPGQGGDGIRFFSVDPAGGNGVIRGGINSLILTAKDSGGKQSRITVIFNVKLVP